MPIKHPPDWALDREKDAVEGVEVRLNDDGTIDEVIAEGFHLEQMEDDAFWMALKVGNQEQHIWLHRHGARVYVTLNS